jgi:uncharacterized membrane protein HdeD (DUF308 family)
MSQSTLPAPARPASSRSGWFVALGIALLALGMLALLDVVAVTLAGAILIGALLLVGGIFQVVHAFVERGWRSFALHLIAGIVYAVAGVLIMDEPVQGSFVITLFLTVLMIVSGGFRIATALRHRDLRGWWLVLLGGIVSLAVGILLYLSLPWSGLWVLGALIGVELIMHGAGWISLGLGLRDASGAAAPT